MEFRTGSERVGRYREGDGLLQTAIRMTFEILSAVMIQIKNFLLVADMPH